jgi:hypothetical protein
VALELARGKPAAPILQAAIEMQSLERFAIHPSLLPFIRHSDGAG